MATDTNSSWFPLFEFQDYIYQSFLILPTAEESAAPPGTTITTKKWAMGDFVCGQAFGNPDGYILDGFIRSKDKDIEFTVAVKGVGGLGNAPATFEATVTGSKGEGVKGAIYQLIGWVFPDQPISQGAGRVQRVQGAIRAVRGTDKNPAKEPGGMDIGTVGAFVINRV